MNYISEVNSFFNWLEDDDKPISSSARMLWLTLMQINNRKAVKCQNEWLWKCEFRVTNQKLVSMTGISREQLHKARNVLIQKGRITYNKAAGSQSGIYEMIPFDDSYKAVYNEECNEKVWFSNLCARKDTQMATQQDTQEDTQMATQQDTQELHKSDSNHLIKVNSNNIINNNIISTESENDEQFSAPCFILPLIGGNSFTVTESDITYYEYLYPACDVRQEFRNMIGWLNANPKKKKTPKGIKRFINSWLSKEQDKGGVLRGKSNSPGTVTDEEFWAEVDREAAKLRTEGLQ